jgi:hypothetical protein
MKKIKYTKKGQPYIIDAKTGRAKFIKKTKSNSRRRTTTKTKTKTRSYKMAKKRKSYRRAKSVLGDLNKPVVGAMGVIAYESFISPMIPLQGVAKDLLELGAGLWASKKRGIIGATGKTLVTINAYQLMSGLIGNKLQGLIGNVNQTSAYNYGGIS